MKPHSHIVLSSEKGPVEPTVHIRPALPHDWLLRNLDAFGATSLEDFQKRMMEAPISAKDSADWEKMLAQITAADVARPGVVIDSIPDDGFHRRQMALIAGVGPARSLFPDGVVLRRTEEGFEPAVNLDERLKRLLSDKAMIPILTDPGPPLPKLHKKKGSTKATRKPKRRKKRNR